MKTVVVVVAGLATLLAVCTVICGMWLHSHGADASSISFHMTIGLATMVLTIATAIGMLVVR